MEMQLRLIEEDKVLNYILTDVSVMILNADDFNVDTPQINFPFKYYKNKKEIFKKIKEMYNTSELNDSTSYNTGKKCIYEEKTGLNCYTNEKGFDDFVCINCVYSKECSKRGEE